jgi:D-arabinose 1-dehydrogenase-like Zn-dependent alcohol dehydrogenase
MPWEPNLIPFQDLEDAAITNLERVHYGDRNIYSILGGAVNNLLEILDIFDDSKVNQTINLSSITTSGQHPTRYPGIGP